MNKNNVPEVADPARLAIAQKPVRPVLRPAYGKTDSAIPKRNLSRLNRKEEHCCSRATD
jgi:hypothetical protein